MHQQYTLLWENILHSVTNRMKYYAEIKLKSNPNVSIQINPKMKS